jgi:hypothetical protein
VFSDSLFSQIPGQPASFPFGIRRRLTYKGLIAIALLRRATFTTASANPIRRLRYLRTRRSACGRSSSSTPDHRAGASSKVRQKGVLRVPPDVRGQQVIHLGKDGPRKPPGVRRLVERRTERPVMAIGPVYQRDHGTGVGTDHRRRPKPASRSTARSLISPRALAAALGGHNPDRHDRWARRSERAPRGVAITSTRAVPRQSSLRGVLVVQRAWR